MLVVVVPRIAMGVDEYTHVRQVVVVIDEVCQVIHCFSPFVLRRVEGRAIVVCEVCGKAVLGQVGRGP